MSVTNLAKLPTLRDHMIECEDRYQQLIEKFDQVDQRFDRLEQILVAIKLAIKD